MGTEYPRRGRGAAATRVHGLSTLEPRRGRDASPRTSRLAADPTRAPQVPTLKEKLDALFARFDTSQNGLIDAEELVELLEALTPENQRQNLKPTLADAYFLLESVDTDGDVATISRDELHDAVLLWRRLEIESRVSQSDRLRIRGRMGWCCTVM